LGDVHAVRQNHSVDQDLKALFEKLDPTRPALTASGDVDLHLMLGWAEGAWRDIGRVEPLMVSAFGAQALPSVDSPAWDGIGARRQAFKATRVIIEPLAFESGRPFGFVQNPRVPFAARLVVVNDDPGVGGRGTVRWTVTREKAAGSRGLERVRDALQKKSYAGAVEVEVPTPFEPAVSATTLSLPLPVEGEYRIDASLLAGGEVIDRAEMNFSVSSTAVPARPRPEIPRYLAERLADLRSLRAEKAGVSFAMENRTRPAVLVGVTGLRLDGVLVTAHQMHIETNAGLAPLPRRLDMPLGRRLVLPVVTAEALGAGAHPLG